MKAWRGRGGSGASPTLNEAQAGADALTEQAALPLRAGRLQALTLGKKQKKPKNQAKL